MCGYVCRYQKRMKQYKFLLCQKMMNEKEDYGKAENAFNAYCLHQHHCTQTRKQENTPEAKNCKRIQSDHKSV